MFNWQKIIFAILVVVVGLLLYVKLFQKNAQDFKVTFFDIGQGDAALIQMETGEKILVDCGPDRKILSKLGRALKFYDREIDYLIATHPDLDHYGGCVDVLKRYKVKKIVTNGKTKEFDPYWRIWDETVREEGAEIFTVDSNFVWNFGNSATMEFFSPDQTLPLNVSPGDGNNYSIVFRLITPSTSILFAGDMETPLEQAIIAKYCPKIEQGVCDKLKANVLKAGHHGSDSSTGEALLRAVQPKKAIVSVGRNRYGHPSLRVIRHMERLGITILRTDESGDIQIE